MQNNILTTPVDNLVEYVKVHKNCSFTEVINHLKFPLEIIEKWFVILEEYSIVKVYYKGFEGYISYVEKEDLKKSKEGEIDIDNLKKIFILKSQDKNFSYEKMRQLWPIFISEYERDIMQLFQDKAKERGYSIEKIDKAWIQFKKELVIF